MKLPGARTKPPQGAWIDWTHPLARGLVGAFLLPAYYGDGVKRATVDNGSTNVVGDAFGNPCLAYAAQTTTITNFPALSRPLSFNLWANGASQSGKTLLQGLTQNNFLIYTRAGNTISLFALVGGEYGYSFTLDGKWHMYTFSVDAAGTVTGWRDGIPQTISTFTAGVSNVATTSTLKIANGFGAFTGAISDVKIYNRVLSNLEVLRLYTEPFAMYLSAPIRRNYFIVPQAAVFRRTLALDGARTGSRGAIG